MLPSFYFSSNRLHICIQQEDSSTKETAIKKRSCRLCKCLRLPNHSRSQRRPRIVEARAAVCISQPGIPGIGQDLHFPAVKVATALHLFLIRKEASVHTHLFPAISIRTKPLSARPSAVAAARTFVGAKQEVLRLSTKRNRTICRLFVFLRGKHRQTLTPEHGHDPEEAEGFERSRSLRKH